ncbi:MAG: insulinase family protein [Candidatus Nomurabacteria bacterium]|nr:insulinase family protein [Candidatus Nomurabacteria bacterium]
MKDNYTKTVLENGLRIVTVPMADSNTTTVMVLVEAGSNYEQKANNGISHFLEHMCFKGTTNRPSSATINYELDAMGSLSNAFTDNEDTGYFAKAHYSKTEKLIDIVSDIFLNSTFPEAEMEREKGVIIEEINMYEDSPSDKVLDVLEELLYSGQAAGRNIAGTRENIRKMTRQDFIDYKRKHYTAGATTVVVCGRINEQKVIEQVEKLFEAMPKGEPATLPEVVENQTKPEVKPFEKDTDQTHLAIGFRAYNRYDEKVPALRVLSAVLGGGMSSRLFQKMREELGICYYTKSIVVPSRNYGSIVLTAGVSSDRLDEAIDGLLSEVRKLKTELVAEEELRKAKDYGIGNLFMRLEPSNVLGEFYGLQELFHDEVIKSPEDYAREIREVTAEEVREVAQEIFVNESMNLATVGPVRDQSELETLFKL